MNVLNFENMDVEFCVDDPYKNVSNNQFVVIEIPSAFNNSPTHSVSNNLDTVNPTPNILMNTSISNLQSSTSTLSLISSDPEFPEPVKVVVHGRKRNLINQKKQKQLIKNHINSDWSFENNCGHKEPNIQCQIFKLSIEDLNLFRYNLSKLSSKIQQDKFILTFLAVTRPKRTNRRKPNSTLRNVIKYYLPNNKGDRIPVCITSFTQITTFTRRRLNLLAATYMLRSSPQEKRGSARSTIQSKEISESIIAFICKLKCKKSHYARCDTGRSYLPPQWSVSYLWKQWKFQRTTEDKPVSSLNKFHKIFTDTFCSRQIWVYNLTFVINFGNSDQSSKNCYLYTWVESESGRGPNEICSALLNFLEQLEERVKNEDSPPKILNLFSDSCSSQNKNQFTIATLLYYINCIQTVFDKINHIFPVRGHSYMPPDQVFGRIEKCLRKKEIIVSPTEYHDTFRQFTKVHILNKDFFMYDFKKYYESKHI